MKGITDQHYLSTDQYAVKQSAFQICLRKQMSATPSSNWSRNQQENLMMSPVSLEKAALYERFRLPYASDAIGGLLEQIGEVDVVADIGAGTGQLARLFAGRCHKVYAVEPDPSMRQTAHESLREFPVVEIINGSAEQTTLIEHSVDLIVIGNAFHRFRPEACEELHRILKKQGWIALFSYSYPDTSLTEILFSELSTIESWTSRLEQARHNVPMQRLLGNGQMDTLNYRQSLTEDREAFFGAACAGIEAPERNDSDFRRFEEINREVFDAFAVDGEIRIEYETTVIFGQPKR